VSRAHGVPPLVIEETDGPGGYRIGVTGDLDLATHGALADVLLRAVRCHERVVVDLDGVAFLDARGIGTLVEAQAAAHARGHALTVDRVGGQPRWLLDLVGVLPRLSGLGPPQAGQPLRNRP